jgi:hypothetical protein
VASAYGWVTIVILSMVKRAHPLYSNSYATIFLPHLSLIFSSCFHSILLLGSLEQLVVATSPFDNKKGFGGFWSTRIVSWCFHAYEVTLFLCAFCGILSRSLE